MELARTGDIQETATSYILVKNPHIDPIDQMGFLNDIIITWGNDNGRIKLMQIEYPKTSFSYDKVMAIQSRLATKGCRYCDDGYDLAKFSGDKSGVTKVFDPIFKGISTQWGLPTKFLSSIAGAFFYSQLGSLAIDYLTTPLGSLIVKIVVGVILLIASLLIKGRADSSERRLKEELYTAGLMFIARALNLNDIELAKLEFGQLNIPQVIAEKGLLAGLGRIGSHIIKADVANYFVRVTPEVREEEAEERPNVMYQFA